MYVHTIIIPVVDIHQRCVRLQSELPLGWIAKRL